jgi:hypothetical protein
VSGSFRSAIKAVDDMHDSLFQCVRLLYATVQQLGVASSELLCTLARTPFIVCVNCCSGGHSTCIGRRGCIRCPAGALADTKLLLRHTTAGACVTAAACVAGEYEQWLLAWSPAWGRGSKGSPRTRHQCGSQGHTHLHRSPYLPVL